MATILAVDDDQGMLMLYERVVRSEGHTFCSAWTAFGALESLRTEPIDLVFLDLELHGLMSGIDVMRHIKPSIPVVVVTGHESVYHEERDDNPDHPLYRTAMAMFKPVSSVQLINAIHHFAKGQAT